MEPSKKPSADQGPTRRTMRGVDREALRDELSRRFEHSLGRLAK